jgi:hypothetical protein
VSNTTLVTHLGYRSFLPADTLPSMTKLSSIPDHEIAIECRVCGHAGCVRVAPILAKGDRTVAELVAAARCSRCKAKIVGTYRIVYGGRSDIAMAMTASMPQDT